MKVQGIYYESAIVVVEAVASVAGESTQAYLQLGKNQLYRESNYNEKRHKKRRGRKEKEKENCVELQRLKRFYKSSLQRVIFRYALFIALSITVSMQRFIVIATKYGVNSFLYTLDNNQRQRLQCTNYPDTKM